VFLRARSVSVEPASPGRLVVVYRVRADDVTYYLRVGEEAGQDLTTDAQVLARLAELGVRVPEVVVSPFSKPRFVSHDVFDHTSILRFVEKRFGLPALTKRDAAADPMSDLFDFERPAFLHPPALRPAVINPAQFAACAV